MQNGIEAQPKNPNRLSPRRIIPKLFIAVTMAFSADSDASNLGVADAQEPVTHTLFLPEILKEVREGTVKIEVSSSSQVLTELAKIEQYREDHPDDDIKFEVLLAEGNYLFDKSLDIPDGTELNGANIDSPPVLTFTDIVGSSAIQMGAHTTLSHIDISLDNSTVNSVIGSASTTKTTGTQTIAYVDITINPETSAVIGPIMDSTVLGTLTVEELIVTGATGPVLHAQAAEVIITNPSSVSDNELSPYAIKAVTPDHVDRANIRIGGGFIKNYKTVLEVDDAASPADVSITSMTYSISGASDAGDVFVGDDIVEAQNPSTIVELNNVYADGVSALNNIVTGPVTLKFINTGIFRVIVGDDNEIFNSNQTIEVQRDPESAKTLLTLLVGSGIDEEVLEALIAKLEDMGFTVETSFDPTETNAQSQKEQALRFMREFLIGKAALDRRLQEETSDAAAGQRRG